MNSRQRRKLKKFINELEEHRGRHTSLVTVYIPKDYDMNKIINHLSQEQGTASNIKDSTTRKNVIDALERMIQHLRLYKKTPTNGLAVFSGNISERQGQQDVQVWSLEPPEPLNFRLYRCDKTFVMDPLIDMAETKDAYGLVVMDRRDARIALLKGKSIIPLDKTTSYVPGKMRAGGQSSQRFERLREGAAKEFYKKVGDYMMENFLKTDLKIKGIIIGGPGKSKNELIDKGAINTEIKEKIIAVKDLSYTGEFGLQELVDKSQDVLAQEEISQEKEIMRQFFEHLSTNPGMVAYGKKETEKCLKIGAVETLLLSEELDDEAIENFEKEAENYSSKVEIISTETREGVQLKDMGKIAAILRYELTY
ncbi:peptide chain release factor 1 [Candidatus Woesearchaeota archaeon]|nr:peptide chain release factor 1 [Candidatus Woesearchaeota archaeon]